MDRVTRERRWNVEKGYVRLRNEFLSFSLPPPLSLPFGLIIPLNKGFEVGEKQRT